MEINFSESFKKAMCVGGFLFLGFPGLFPYQNYILNSSIYNSNLETINEIQTTELYKHGTVENNEYYLISEMPDIKPVSIEEINFPFTESDYLGWSRGYFEGHYGWDIFLKGRTDHTVLQVPHEDSIFLAGIPKVRGDHRVELGLSGVVEFFYLNTIEKGPIVIIYCHVTENSVYQAVTDAEENMGRIDNAGHVGHTGYTDGRHIHLAVLDANLLIDLYEAENIIQAFEYVLEDPTELYKAYFNPEEIFPNIRDPARFIIPCYDSTKE